MSSLRAGKPMAGRSLNSLNITATHSHRKSLYNHHHSLSSSPMKSGTCDTIINDILFCVGLCYLFGKFQFFSPQLCRYSWTDLNQHLSTDLIFQRLKIQFCCDVHAPRSQSRCFVPWALNKALCPLSLASADTHMYQHKYKYKYAHAKRYVICTQNPWPTKHSYTYNLSPQHSY